MVLKNVFMILWSYIVVYLQIGMCHHIIDYHTKKFFKEIDALKDHQEYPTNKNNNTSL